MRKVQNPLVTKPGKEDKKIAEKAQIKEKDHIPTSLFDDDDSPHIQTTNQTK
jgi:hypothetical protein